MSQLIDDTIAAIATAPGEGSLCIVRVSGTDAFQIVDRVFRGRYSPSKCLSHTIHYGHIFDPQSNQNIDEVLISIFRSPRSFTTEDMVEISGHGGFRPGSLILDVLLRNGARLADPGEYTKRAFLNGRLDLAQAEAVADIIRGRTDASVRTALRQLDGRFSDTIQELRSRVIDLLALVEVGLDFTEEDIDEFSYTHLLSLARPILLDLQKLKNDSQKWRILRDGARIALVGKPNVGKSSLLNQLTGKERAIVDSLPGTTRDTVEAMIDVNGIPVTFVDTAGIRTPGNNIEAQGIERSRAEIDTADLFIWILDQSSALNEMDFDLLNYLDPSRTLGVVNKIDQSCHIDPSDIDFTPVHPWQSISALHGSGIDSLKSSIYNILIGDTNRSESDVILNHRHLSLLDEALLSLSQSVDMFKCGHGEEIISIELRKASHSLGEILGLEVGDDILDRIFSSFCIGK